MMNKKRVLAIGGIYVDINCFDYPHEGQIEAEIELDGDRYEAIAGGSGVNFGRLCVALGLEATFVGKIGADPMGHLAKELLTQDGIQPALAVDETVQTNVAVNLVNAKGVTIMPGMGNANQALGPDDVLSVVEPLLADLDYLYLGTCLKLKRLLPIYEQLAKDARAQNVVVVVDHGRVVPGADEQDVRSVRELVLTADLYLPSRDEFLKVWGVDSIEAGLRLLAENDTAPVTVVKDGENGALTWQDGQLKQVPAFPTEIANTVGAGDSFNAGLIDAQADGLPLLESMRFGCAVAALKISGKPFSREAIQRILS